MLNYSILLKKISKFENINIIKDVINSVNDNSGTTILNECNNFTPPRSNLDLSDKNAVDNR